jgi:hypothetical protein
MVRCIGAIGLTVGLAGFLAACGSSPTSPSKSSSSLQVGLTETESSVITQTSIGADATASAAAVKTAYCSATIEFASANPSFGTIMIATGWAGYPSPDPGWNVWSVVLTSTFGSKYRSGQCSNAGGFYSTPTLRFPKK